MKEIVKVLLQEGVDEETIHGVLQILEDGRSRHKDFFYRYDTRTFPTKKKALEAVGTKDQYSSPSKYYRSKNSITKEYYFPRSKKVN